MKKRVLWILASVGVLFGQPVCALSPADEAEMVRGMAYLRTNYNDSDGLRIVGDVINRTNYTADQWADYYRRYFTTNTYTYPLRFNWYWRHGHINGWATPERALIQQLALYQIITNRITSLYVAHPADLGRHLEGLGSAGIEDLVAWNLQLWDIGTAPAPGFDARSRIVEWLVRLRGEHPQWLAPGRFLDPARQPYAAQFHVQHQLTIRDVLQRLGETRSNIADKLALAGLRQRIFEKHGQQLLDNDFLAAGDLGSLDTFLDLLPAHLPKTPYLFWSTQIGNTGNRSTPFAHDGLANGMTDWHAGEQRDAYWQTEDAPIATDASIGHVVGEAFYAWRPWMTSAGMDGRRDTLRQSAGRDPANYLLSKRVAAEPDIYERWLEGFFFDLNRTCFNHTEAAFTSASRRFLLEGRFQPLAQFLWWLDVWSGLGSTAKGFVLDARGNITHYDIPLSRDGSGRIRTLQLGGVTWQVGYFTSTRPSSLRPVESSPLQVASVGQILGGTNLLVTFDDWISPATATNTANYTVGGTRPIRVTLLPDLRSVELSLTAFSGAETGLTITNLQDLAGNGLGSSATVPVRSSVWQAADIGPAADMQPPSRSVMIDQTSFDLHVGGSIDYNDNEHFVCRVQEGDFDAQVRVAGIESAEGLASATLQVRDSLTAFNQVIGVRGYNPSGRNGFLTVWRPTPGAPYQPWPSSQHFEANVGPDSVLRLVRQGNRFTALVNSGGTTWHVMGHAATVAPERMLLGLAATARNAGRPNPVHARFRGLSVTAPRPLVWLQHSLLSTTLLESGGRVARLQVRSSAALTNAQAVKLTFTGTATAGSDYVPLPAEIVIPPGEVDAVVEVRLRDDALTEGPETLQVAIAADAAYEIVDSPVDLTLLDDEDPRGGLARSFYLDVGINQLTNLTRSPKFPNRPDISDVISTFELPAGAVDFNHGTRVTGYLIPPETGDYRFFIHSADESELYLSTDASPANAVKIAQEPQWSAYREWYVRANGEKASEAIRLEAGKRYFVEYRHIRGGANHFGVAWRRSGEGSPAKGAEPIPGEYLAFRTEDLAPAMHPAFWVQWPSASGGNDHWYGLLPGNLRWTEAEAYANAQPGTHLVTIQSLAEQDFLWNTFPRTNLWIGLTDEGTQGRFRWANGEALDFTHWQPGQPDNVLGEDYGLLTGFWNGRWSDLPAGVSSGANALGGALLERISPPTVTPGTILIHRWPTNQWVLPGATARLAVETQGAIPVAYQWQFNGEDINDATNAVLEIPGATTDLSGRYRVRVSSSGGQITSPDAVLRVSLPLRWIAQPQGAVAVTGRTVLLGALAEGAGPVSYQWLFKGVKLPGQTNATLVRTSVSPADIGEYRVLATDSWSGIGSAVARLDVVSNDSTNAPSMRVHFLEHFDASPASSFWSVRDRVSSRTANAVTRRFLGEFGAEEVRMALTDLPPHTLARLTGDLFVLKTWDGDQGGPDIWGFRIDDGAGFEATFSNWEELGYTQSYPEPAGLGTFPAGTGAREKDTLGNTYPGDSVYGLDWTFGHTNSALTVTFFGRNLQALADESWGLNAVRVELDAPPPLPRIAVQPADALVSFGSSHLLSVGMERPLPLQYLWRKDGVPVVGGTNRTLSLNLSTAAEFGGYDVIVANAAGSVTSRVAQLGWRTNFVSFTTNVMRVSELQGIVEIPLVRTGNTNWVYPDIVSSGSAVTNVDFFGLGSGPFPAGQTNVILSLRILDDDVADGLKTLTLTVGPRRSPDIEPGPISSLTIQMEDNDTEAGPGLGFDGRIGAIVPMPDGGVLVGGEFRTANGTRRQTVARLRADFSLDLGFVPELPGWTSTTGLGWQPEGGVVVTGGSTSRLWLLKADGRAASKYHPGFINSLGIDGDGRVILAGLLYAGYQFFFDRNLPIVQTLAVVRLLPDGTRDTEFNVAHAVNALPSTGRSVTLRRDGAMVVGGTFNNSGTFTNRGRIARVLAQGTFDSSFGTGVGFNNQVGAVVEDRRGGVYVAGAFRQFGTNLVSGMARLDFDGQLDTTFNPTNSGTNITSLAVLPDGNLLALRTTGVLEEYQPNGQAVGTLATNATAFAVEPSGWVVVGEGTPGRLRRLRPTGAPSIARVELPWGVRTVAESDDRVRLQVRRTGPSDDPVEVRYRVMPVTAVDRTDLAATNGVVRINQGQHEAWIEVPLTAQNTIPNDDRTFRVELADATGATLITGRSDCVVTIQDDDRGLLAEIFATETSSRLFPRGTSPNDLLHPFSIFDRRLESRRDPVVHFEWGNDGPRAELSDQFAVIWSGWLVPESSGEYQLATLSDDGSRIWLDGNLELKRWRHQSPTLSATRPIALTAGRPYRLVVHHFEDQAEAICRLLWRRVGSNLYETIPSRLLRPAGFSQERPTLGVAWSPDSEGFQFRYTTEPGRPIRIEHTTNSVDWTFLLEGNSESNGIPVEWTITQTNWNTQFPAGAVLRARTFDGLVSDTTGPLPLVARVQRTGIGLVAGATNSVTLTAQANGGAGQTIAWLKDGVEVAVGPTLPLFANSPGVEGDYQALVTAAAGRATSAVHRIRLHRPPVIERPLMQQKWEVGSAPSLSAGISGVELRYQWYKGSSPLSLQTQATLIPGIITMASAGQYSVVASNAAGSITNGPVTITVEERPRIAGWQVQPDGQVSLTVEGSNPSMWLLEGSADLREWVPVENPVLLPAGAGFAVPVSSETSGRFFRVRLR